MKIIPSSKQYKSWNLASKWSYMAGILSIIGLILSITLSLISNYPKDNIDSKIKELDNIKTALTTLNSYVDKQQNLLKSISSEKSTLEKEKSDIQKALEIDKERLDAFMNHYALQTKSTKWLEILISFFVGVLSSSLVTFFAIKYQRKT